MNKDRQHIQHDIETRNSIIYEHNTTKESLIVGCHITQLPYFL